MKLTFANKQPDGVESPPARGARIEILRLRLKGSSSSSPPARGRGLKWTESAAKIYQKKHVAPRTGGAD